MSSQLDTVIPNSFSHHFQHRDVMTRSDCVLDAPDTTMVDVDWLADRIEQSCNNDRSLLIVDCRPIDEYQATGHVINSIHVTVPGLIHKRLVKGMSSAMCVLPANQSTTAIRQKLQTCPDQVDVVVIASIPSSHRQPSTPTTTNQLDTLKLNASAASQSMSIGRLLVQRFAKMSCAAHLLQEDIQTVRARYPYLCEDSESNTTNPDSNTLLPPPPLATKANRPTNLGLTLLPSLDHLSLSDSHSSAMLLNHTPATAGSNSTDTSTLCASSRSVGHSGRLLLSASSSSSCASDVFSETQQGSSAVSRTTSNGSSVTSPGGHRRHQRTGSPPRCKYASHQSISLDKYNGVEKTCKRTLSTAVTANCSSPIFKDSGMSRRLSSSAPVSSSSPIFEPQFTADSCWVNFEKYNGAISGFPVPITSNLYLGNAHNSTDRRVLDLYNIRYIINVTPDLPNQFIDDDDFHYLQVPVTDHWSQSLIPSYLPQCVSFIEAARKSGHNVLVHCLAGISRSVTITVAYMMQAYAMSLDEAYDWVKLRKGNIAPNFNFMGQLLDLERQLRNGSGSPDSGQFSSDEADSCPSTHRQRPSDTLQNRVPAPVVPVPQPFTPSTLVTNTTHHIKLNQPPVGRKRQHQLTNPIVTNNKDSESPSSLTSDATKENDNQSVTPGDCTTNNSVSQS